MYIYNLLYAQYARRNSVNVRQGEIHIIISMVLLL